MLLAADPRLESRGYEDLIDICTSVAVAEAAPG